MTTILRDKTTMCISQEKKIAALVNQVESLKEVVAITKDLLNIRNMEVQHLSNDITAMETKIDCERQRHNQVRIDLFPPPPSSEEYFNVRFYKKKKL